MGTSRLVTAWLLLFAGLGGFHLTAASPDTPPGEEPWVAAPPFSIPARDVASAVAALPPPGSAAIEILFFDVSLTLDEQGRKETTTHLLYRILTPAGVEGGSAVRRVWAPWREKRPSIRGRVITSAGVQHDLDPATLTDGPLGTLDRHVFSDMRVLEGPLPAVSAGSTIEIKIVEEEEKSFFDAGTVSSLTIGDSSPVRRARVSVEAPESIPLRFASRPAGAFRELDELTGGKRRRTFSLESFEPPSDPEAFTPPEQDPTPLVSVSTGESWASVASAYAAVLERQIAGSDLRPVVRKATAAAGTREEKVLALLRYLHDTVRYTGVEFGWAGIVPEKPASTLARKYGDCKDKSVLLVALLREAGIPAHLALLEAGSGSDVERDLPGLGRFDHAVVRVDLDPAAWIDATDEHSEPDNLRAGVAGRLALVIQEGVSGLVQIPEPRSTDHRTVEVREFFLAEAGPARIVETTTVHGRYAADYRRMYAKGDAKEIEDHLTNYVREAFGAGKLDRYVPSDPRDIARPFELRLETGDATAGQSNGSEIQVPVHLDGLVSSLAMLVPPRFPRGQVDNETGGKDPDPKRRSDFLLVTPYVSELKYRIHPPTGFSSLPLPSPVERAIGPGSLTAEFRKGDDGTVLVEARFDTGPSRWTAEEYEAARRAIHEVVRDSPWIVSFEQSGEAQLKAGNLAAAMTEFRRLAALHPGQAMHHGQIARTLLAAGFGEAARREARRGVELEPENSLAQKDLGFVLLHDALGRESRPGWDRDGAEAALRKAKALDPKNTPARTLLALVLEYDADGDRYAPGSRLAEAIEEYRSLRADLGETPADLALLRCLGYAGRFRELRDEAAVLGESPERNAFLVAAAGAASGIEAARGEAARLTSTLSDRRKLMATAGALLLIFRRYPEARALFEEGLQESEAAAQGRVFLEALGKMRRHEELTFDPLKPDQFVLEYLRTFLTQGDPAGPAFRALLSRHVQLTDAELRKTMQAMRQMFRVMVGEWFTPDTAMDMGLAVLESRASPIGSTGFQVETHSSAGGREQSWSMLLVREDERLKFIAAAPDFSGVGRLVEQLIGQGNTEDARQWLNRVRESLQSARTDDPVAAHPMAVLWSPGDPPQPAAMRAAAVALRIKPGGSGDEADLLQQLRGERPEEDRWKFDYALALAHGAAKRYDAALSCAERVLAAHPGSRAARSLLAGFLQSAGRPDEMESRAREWLADDPASREGLRFLLVAAQMRDDLDAAMKAFSRMEGAGRTEAFDFNNQAWLLVEHGRPEEALALAQRAVRENGREAPLHTLALVYADLGRLTDARDTILRKIEWFDGGVPQPIDALVFGRIAEQMGETALASETYRQSLGALKDASPSTRRLLERRLQALGQDQKKGKKKVGGKGSPGQG